MSNNEQSLDEDVVFLPVDETSPEFLYCEREREAVEKLLSAGPEAFYHSVVKELPSCFLSSEEVSQLTSWVQSYHFNKPQVQQENGVESIRETEDFCSSYFPCHSDVPVPNLELGWPNKIPWSVMSSVTVHTSPSEEGEPSVREVIRRHLQRARQVIAIVTDRLTDAAIIGDLHSAASQGVPVYIILNQRSIQETFSLNRLRHPNIRVRALGGRSFCLRDGRKVVGEMKEKFLLVDLDTVIHGSCSFTWTDTHLHRQLITVLKGPAVDSFDKEFRTLYANSLPVPATVTHVNCHHQLKDFSAHRLQKQISVDPEITNPPSPRADSPLDWEEMGVFSKDTSLPTSPLYLHGEIVTHEMPPQNSMQLDKITALMDGFTNNQNHFVDKRRIKENPSPVATEVVEKSTFFMNREPLSTQPATSERTKREPLPVEPATSERTKRKDRDPFRHHPTEGSTSLHVRNTTTFDDKPEEPTHRRYSLKTREPSRRESILEEESIISDCIIPKVENKPSSRKAIICVQRNENFSALSDIMKKIPQTSSGLLKRDSKSIHAQSMWDLSKEGTATSHDKTGFAVPRFTRTSHEPAYITPALALMEKRNDKVRSTLMPKERPRRHSFFGADFGRSLAEKKGRAGEKHE